MKFQIVEFDDVKEIEVENITINSKKEVIAELNYTIVKNDEFVFGADILLRFSSERFENAKAKVENICVELLQRSSTDEIIEFLSGNVDFFEIDVYTLGDDFE